METFAWKKSITSYKVCSKIFMLHISTIFNKNSHTCERSAMEIDKREHYQDISIDTLSFLHKKKVEQGKRIFYGDL